MKCKTSGEINPWPSNEQYIKDLTLLPNADLLFVLYDFTDPALIRYAPADNTFKRIVNPTDGTTRFYVQGIHKTKKRYGSFLIIQFIDILPI
ncbi:MAG: hypothetical protein HC896_07970 [Bacteroidales bacterium]|nr:hypothetical protein [Bacteroidales bacterium]